MAFSAGTSSGPSSEINVTPLIDVLLVLLIIFMVIVPSTQRGLDSSVPQNKAGTILSQPTMVELRAGTTPGEVIYSVNRREVLRDAIGPMLRGIFAAQPEHTVILTADRKLTYEPVAWTAGEAKRAGATGLVLTGQK